MVESATKNYGWIKPEVQHSPSTWGGFINNNFDAIDALVFANQQAAAPVGGGRALVHGDRRRRTG